PRARSGGCSRSWRFPSSAHTRRTRQRERGSRASGSIGHVRLTAKPVSDQRRLRQHPGLYRHVGSGSRTPCRHRNRCGRASLGYPAGCRLLFVAHVSRSAWLTLRVGIQLWRPGLTPLVRVCLLAAAGGFRSAGPVLRLAGLSRSLVWHNSTPWGLTRLSLSSALITRFSCSSNASICSRKAGLSRRTPTEMPNVI